MSHPWRENLRVESAANGKWLCCTRCGHRLSAFGRDWQTDCVQRIFPPTKAGPLMDVLDGHYLLQKLYCPSCGVLLDSDMIEEKK